MTENPITPETDDGGVRQPKVKLRTVLALLRILAGRRGFASVRWSGQGFTYILLTERHVPVPFEVDDDETATGHDEALRRLRDHLT